MDNHILADLNLAVVLLLQTDNDGPSQYHMNIAFNLLQFLAFYCEDYKSTLLTYNFCSYFIVYSL